MRKTLTGLLLCGTSLLAQQFFSHYKGTLIPFPHFFAISSILLIPLGIIFVFYGWQDLEKRKKEREEKAMLELRNKGEKIVVEYENCSFGTKENTEEKTDIPSSTSDYGPTGREPLLRPEDQQSMIIYHHRNGARVENFPSPVFRMDPFSLQVHIKKKDLILYVDRKDHSRFFFDLHDTHLAEMEAEYPA